MFQSKCHMKMNEQYPILPPPGTIPLFVDVGAQVTVSGVFLPVCLNHETQQIDSWVKNSYSSLPIIAQSQFYPNKYFSLIPKDKCPDRILTNRQFKIKSYSQYYIQKKDDDIILYCIDDNDDIFFVCENILNPIGIGAFYDKQYSIFLSMPENIAEEYGKSFDFKPVPYSMEIVKQIIFPTKNSSQIENNGFDLDPLSVACLMVLQYKLPNIIIPQPNMDSIKNRFIFKYIMLQNPPTFYGKPNYSFALKNIEKGMIRLLENVEPYQWVHISFFHFGEGQFEDVRAIIGDPTKYELDVLNYKKGEGFRVDKFLVKDEVDIMSPAGGELWLHGIIDCGEFLSVDVFLY
ncbi:hypothetical protein TRFO_06273 [Tritrichomonas foetus]|uniref:Uncharacterized protein n=1 Tax=Tritrichomonas foetus TaxID=1144522 RepID=A0A1J4JYZ8_9EUKA|nr:hypothetical protein TRFO_06273 [Tritrichomonas foetus]|eukprot:OHT04399.1 hypothetical protein TRFO_06273 [Tritrichomonas foetus]